MILTSKLARAVLIILLPVFFTTVAHAQIKPVQLDVRKVSKKDTKTVYRNDRGNSRDQQVNETIHYSIEVVNSSTVPLPDLKIKWAVLYDASEATAHGGGGVSVTAWGLEVLEGERVCSLAFGQKYVFDTEPFDLSSVNSSRPNTTVQDCRGGQVVGYAVEVFLGDKLVASDIRPSDTKSRIEKLKSSKRRRRG